MRISRDQFNEGRTGERVYKQEKRNERKAMRETIKAWKKAGREDMKKSSNAIEVIDDDNKETTSGTVTGVTVVSVTALIAGASYFAMMKNTNEFRSDVTSSLIDQE